MLSKADIDHFGLEGWLRLSGLVSGEELEQLRTETTELIDRGKDRNQSDEVFQYGPAPHDENVKTFFRINDVISKHRIQSIECLLGHPDLLAAVADLVGNVPFVSTTESLVFKLSGMGFAHLWHQDPPAIRSFPSIMAGVYLDRSDEDNGALQIVPRSHLSGYHGGHDWVFSITGGPHGTRAPKVTLSAEPGDVLLHATTLIHGSPWSSAQDLRRTVYFHFNHFNDVRLQAPDYWTRRTYLADQDRLRTAIAKRRSVMPRSRVFDAKWVEPEALAQVRVEKSADRLAN